MQNYENAISGSLLEETAIPETALWCDLESKKEIFKMCTWQLMELAARSSSDRPGNAQEGEPPTTRRRLTFNEEQLNESNADGAAQAMRADLHGQESP